MKQTLSAAAVLAVAVAAVGVPGTPGAVQPNASASITHQVNSCKAKVVKLGGKRACIAAGKPCNAKYERTYEKYGFVCRGGTLYKKPAIVPAAQVVATIPVGPGPGAIRYLDGSIWVQSFADGTVSRIDPATNTVVATIPAGGGGWGDLTYGDGSLWTVSEAKGAVSRIDPITNSVVATIPSHGIRPMGLAWTPGALWVGNHGHPVGDKAIVARIDTATNGVVWTGGVGIAESSGTGGPFKMTAAFGSVWVQVPNNGELDRIDPIDNSITPIPSEPCDGDSEAVGGAVWLSDGCSLSLRRVDPATNTIVARVPYPAGSGLVGPLTADGGFLWATMAPATTGPPKLLAEFDPASGKVVGMWRHAAEGLFAGPAPLTWGDGSIWVSDTPRARVLRLKP